MNFTIDISSFLLVGYVLCFIFLNVITYLISTFYRRTIQHPSMRAGFLIAIITLSCFIPVHLITASNRGVLKIVELLLLLTGSGASLWNSIILYMNMKKVQK
jgi:hypothetical protein